MNSPPAGRKSETQSMAHSEPLVRNKPPLHTSTASTPQLNLCPIKHHDEHSRNNSDLNHHGILPALEKTDTQQPNKQPKLCSMLTPPQADSITLNKLTPTDSKNSLETVSLTSLKEEASDTVIVDIPTHCGYIDRSVSSGSPVFIETSLDEKDPDHTLGWYLCLKPSATEHNNNTLAQTKSSFSQLSGLEPEAINGSNVGLKTQKKIIGTYITEKGFAGEIFDDYY